ncbi:hypothetical protein H0H93_005065 [Arthromyces matolae]|nr:hypothetical protein H0H93_005065 [Arthromyces matolae]
MPSYRPSHCGLICTPFPSFVHLGFTVLNLVPVLPSFTFTGGNNVTLRGSTDPNWGWIDGHDQAWWDTRNQDNRPHTFTFAKVSNGVIRDMRHLSQTTSKTAAYLIQPGPSFPPLRARLEVDHDLSSGTTYVANATGREVVIFDLYPNTASNIVAKDIFSTTNSLHPVTTLCDLPR